LTYNLHAELKALDPMIALIRAADADIVNLQELGFETARRFDAEFATLYPYRAFHPHPWPSAGQGVMSRFPVREDAYWQHSQIHDALGHQRVVIDVRGTRITLYNTHPVHPGMAESGFNTGPRGQEIRDILARAEKENSLVLIAGDFNMSDQSDDYRYITARYGDSYREVGTGLGLSFPDWSQPSARTSNLAHYLGFLPLLVRLDYVFHNAHLRPLEARVWPGAGGSDHRPVWVQLAMR
jgi:vancomycin resistance protein VanJ